MPFLPFGHLDVGRFASLERLEGFAGDWDGQRGTDNSVDKALVRRVNHRKLQCNIDLLLKSRTRAWTVRDLLSRGNIWRSSMLTKQLLPLRSINQRH